MRYFDDFGNELLESEINLSRGYLTTGTTIKVDAKPIDNITKFVWNDDDYEVVQYYHLFSNVVNDKAPRNIVVGEYVTVNGTLYKAIANIPNGEAIVIGQNAVKTTVEDQLYELTKGE